MSAGKLKAKSKTSAGVPMSTESISRWGFLLTVPNVPSERCRSAEWPRNRAS